MTPPGWMRRHIMEKSLESSGTSSVWRGVLLPSSYMFPSSLFHPLDRLGEGRSDVRFPSDCRGILVVVFPRGKRCFDYYCYNCIQLYYACVRGAFSVAFLLDRRSRREDDILMSTHLKNATLLDEKVGRVPQFSLDEIMKMNESKFQML